MSMRYTVACLLRVDKQGKALNPSCAGGFEIDEWTGDAKCGTCGTNLKLLDQYRIIPLR